MWKTLALGAGFALLTTAAAAQSQCNKRQHVLDLLAKKYKEAPVASGVTNNGGLVEVLTDAKGGTWTIIVTTPQGMSCLVAAGEGWRNMEQIALDPEA
ncbi:MAG: hypothetical protein ACE5GS_07815 [Kiloniellaceae bacterium]